MGFMDMQSEQRQQQTFSPRLQQAVRLLQLSSTDFAQEVHDALGRNPFLDSDLDDDLDRGEAELPFATALHQADVEAGGDDTPAADNDRELWLNDAFAASRQGGSEGLGALDHVAMASSLAGHLHEQLAGQALAGRERLLAQVLIESLDDDGYLRSTLEELLTLTDLSPAATLAEMNLALQRVQAMEPAGVAARTVGECLRLQLPLIECPQERALAALIIDQHLHSLARRDVPAMARALGRTAAQIEQVCDRIRHLAPRPGWHVDTSPLHYVVPDVIVRKLRGEWTVRLNPVIVPRVRLNREVAELFQRCRRDKPGSAPAEQAGDLAQHLQDAQWTLRNVELRFSTILDVTEAIVRRQKHFLEFGTMAMKPMGLRDIADELGLHESTVSRVTNNKYMATPLGVFELKYFFSRAMATTSGGACSGTAIRGLVQDMIEAELPSAPLSDAEIARQLARQGLAVARRTVTKYRQLLRIDAVDRRRRVATTP